MTRSLTAASVASGLAVSVLAGCSLDVHLGDTTRRVETDSVPADGVAALVVETDNGGVDVRGADVDEIVVESIFEEVDEGDGSSTIDRDGNRLLVSGDCDSSWRKRCSVGFRITVPRSVDVEISTDNGRIELTSVAGDVVMKTDNGSIQAETLDATDVHARTDNGRIELSFTAAPDRVDARTDNGRIEVEVPAVDSGYDVDAGSDNGDVDIDVPERADSPRSISAHTDNGAVRITVPTRSQAG